MRRVIGSLVLAAMLAGCGGDSGGSGAIATGGGGAPAPTPSPSPTPTTAVAGCSLRERQDWAAAQIREWYLFPDTLPASLDPTPYTSVEDYIDALTATARAQRKDRYFSYLTSIKGENAYYNQGTSDAGFGVRLGYDSAAGRIYVIESFEGAPALAAGVDRGAEIVAVGTTANNLQTVSSLIASQGVDAVSDALGPDTAGTARVLQVRDASGTRTVTITKASYDIAPVSSRYGAKILSDAGGQYGYVNLRTFINPAEKPLRDAFQQFKAAGITKVIVDLRYNGGGLINIAELFDNLMGAGRSTSDVLDYVSFRPEKSFKNSTTTFSPQPESIQPTRIAFIGTGGTASASELVINAQVPYLHANAGLIGTNTYGKPVGQIALDNGPCDDRLRLIALAIQNANHVGDYYNGLAGTVEASCQADDDIGHPLGDPSEGSTRAALDFLEGKSCTPIPVGQTTQSVGKRRDLLTPVRPTTAQRETPGLF